MTPRSIPTDASQCMIDAVLRHMTALSALGTRLQITYDAGGAPDVTYVWINAALERAYDAASALLEDLTRRRALASCSSSSPSVRHLPLPVSRTRAESDRREARSE